MDIQQAKEKAKEIVESYDESLFREQIFSFWKIVAERYKDGISNPILKFNLWKDYGFEREELEAIFEKLVKGIELNGFIYKLKELLKPNEVVYLAVIDKSEKLKKLEEIFKIDLRPEDLETMFPKVKRNGITVNSLTDLLSILPPQPPESRRRELFYEDVEVKFDDFGIMRREKKYAVWKLEFEKGQEPVFVFCDPDVNLLAIPEINLKPLNLEELLQYENALRYIAEKLKLKEDKERVLRLKFFKLAEELPLELFEKFLNLKDALKNLDKILLNEEVLDAKVLKLYKIKALNFSRKAKPEYQKYQSHSLLITQTKVAKTTLAEILHGRDSVYGSGSASRLLGFSTAEEVYQSEVDERVEPTFIDEINSQNWEKLFFDALPNLMENGFVQVAKGKQSIKVKTLTSFTFISNTGSVSQAKPIDLYIFFETFLSMFSESPQRVGSRIAVIFFGNNFKQVDGLIRPNYQAISLWRKICKKISELAELLVNNEEVEKWLNTKIEYYNETIDILTQQLPNGKVKDFWLGNKEAYRHINGTALLFALYDYVKEHQEVLRTREFDFNELYELFEEKQKIICEWNIESLKQMIESIPKEDEKRLLKLQFDSNPMYVKLLLLSIAEYVAENKEQVKEEVLYPLDFLKPYFEDLPEELKRSWYSNFARMKQALNSIKNFDRINSFIKYYQVEITVNQNELFFRIRDKNIILNLRDIYLQNPSTSSTASTHLQASETQYNASLEGSKISSTSSTKQYIEDKLTDKEEDKQESEELSKKSKAKTTPSESFINEGIKPNRRVEEVEEVDKFCRTISQSEEKNESRDKTEKEEESNKSTDKSENTSYWQKLERDVIEVIKNPPVGKCAHDFEVINFVKQRDYVKQEADIVKILEKLLKEGIIIQNSNGSFDINWSKWHGDG
jgi:hypothetical protein